MPLTHVGWSALAVLLSAAVVSQCCAGEPSLAPTSRRARSLSPRPSSGPMANIPGSRRG